MANPYGMDDACTRCAELVESRSNIVHGYGDVAADFAFVAERPAPIADRLGVPVPADDENSPVIELLAACGFIADRTDADGHPVLENAFLTHLTRCRHPERPPTDQEIAACDGFLTAELRTINPEILVPLGERVLARLADEYTTSLPEGWDIAEVHATELRGRGFEIIPLVAPTAMSEEQFGAAIDRIDRTLERDYRQTKGRRNR